MPADETAQQLQDINRQLHDRVMDIAILTDHYETRHAATQSQHAAQIAALTATLADAQKKRASHWRNLEQERKALKVMRKKTDILAQSLRDEQARVAALLASTSWKITRPLRAVLRLTRK